jgi:penicillin-binding protein 1C
MVIENATGDVLAYVGNTGAASSARYVDGIHAQRQAGSTLKPFLYGLAFENRLLTTASLIDDSPLDIQVGVGIYRPRNYDNQFNGLVTARTALASSLNVPAVKTLNIVGVDAFLAKLKELGFRYLQAADFYGPSLALGSADITLWDLVNAYRTLANHGIWTEMRLAMDFSAEAQRSLRLCGDLPSDFSPQRHRVRRVSAEKSVWATRKRIYSEQTAFLISNILSDRESRSKTFSLESPLASRFWTAVKTGTSKEMRDNWCVGFSSEYTVGVWVGNFSGEPMWNVSGITGAAPVWIEIMNWLHRSRPSRPPNPPAGVVAMRTDIPELGQTRVEWFIEGTETTEVRAARSYTPPRIVYPVAGTVIALDPDIPEDGQRLFFKSQPAGNPLRWELDGQAIGPAGSVHLWKPLTGKHKLSLLDDQDRPVDSVDFEVRGADRRKAGR